MSDIEKRWTEWRDLAWSFGRDVRGENALQHLFDAAQPPTGWRSVKDDPPPPEVKPVEHWDNLIEVWDANMRCADACHVSNAGSYQWWRPKSAPPPTPDPAEVAFEEWWGQLPNWRHGEPDTKKLPNSASAYIRSAELIWKAALEWRERQNDPRDYSPNDGR